MKFILDKYFAKTKGLYPFFKYCPKRYWGYYIKKRTEDTLGYDYNPENPKTFNEKIRWLIYNEKLELKTKLADKILLKGYVASKLGANHTAELYGIYDNFKETDFSVLPNRFALKANHGWRMNVIIKNKKDVYKYYDIIRKRTDKWLKINYEEFSVEPQYRNIKRKLFTEQLRDERKYQSDIQVFCFNGKAPYIELKQIKDPQTQKTIVGQIYDRDWNLQSFTTSGPSAGNPVPPPDKLDKIIEYAQVLSKEFTFVRVDFAFDEENIHVVEMTFTPCSAMIPFKDKSIDYHWGEMLTLPITGEAENV